MAYVVWGLGQPRPMWVGNDGKFDAGTSEAAQQRACELERCVPVFREHIGLPKPPHVSVIECVFFKGHLMNACRLPRVVFLVLALLAATVDAGPTPWWGAELAQPLARAGDNRGELEKALGSVPVEQREGLAFLIANMPDGDLRSLSAEFLLTNTALAYKARAQVPWGKQIPEAIFLNNVLPYANVDEKRDAWRQRFYDLCLPIVKGCKSPAEAAIKLNTQLFPELKLRYSTQRKAPNQSPSESIEQGKATCTGLSIVLADACRAVCVPARLVGTPRWSNDKGNHTWVEVWDGGWHFTGAAEPDARGLDRGWFTGAARMAQKDSLEHAIYAVSFRKTAHSFPLAWDPADKSTSAENVTDRYTRPASGGPDAAQSADALNALRAVLAKPPADLAALAGEGFADVALTKADAAAARELLWKAHVALIEKQRAPEVNDRVLTENNLKMPFWFKTFGTRPAAGWSLWVSLHGGGGAPAAINDQQYENQKHLYTLHKGIYLVPRAPTNTWNLWHQPHIDRMFKRMIEDLIVLKGVNPDRVYVMGYSAGGDGVYELAPRMADTWAGAAMMAGHPNGVSILSLRNVPFALQVGANDAAYNRNKIAGQYGEWLDKLQKEDPAGYKHFVRIYPGMGHWMKLKDAAALPWLAKFTRDPIPRRVVWKQTETPHRRSYWLAVPDEPKLGSLVVAERDGQTIQITAAQDVPTLLIRLDDRMAELDKPVVVTRDGKELFRGVPRRTIAVMVETLVGRGDPKLVFDAQVSVSL